MTVLEKPRTAEEYREWWEAQRPDIPYGLCWCGCGEKTTISVDQNRKLLRFKNEPFRLIHGHKAPKKPPLDHRAWWEVQRPDIPYGYCWCGCGGQTSLSRYTNWRDYRLKDQPLRFIQGHKLKKPKKPPEPPKPAENTEPVDGICTYPGCKTRINREHLRKGWRVCMKCDKEKSA